ncbi:hypothetical protein ACHAXT_012708 [Thalassiosira profunda]
MTRRTITPHSLLLASFALLTLLAGSPLLLPAVDGAKQKTHYQVLEVNEDATLKDIKKAYRRIAWRFHEEDATGEFNEEEQAEKFQEFAKAFEVLTDKDSRKEYDRALKGGFGGEEDGAGHTRCGDSL